MDHLLYHSNSLSNINHLISDNLACYAQGSSPQQIAKALTILISLTDSKTDNRENIMNILHSIPSAEFNHYFYGVMHEHLTKQLFTDSKIVEIIGLMTGIARERGVRFEVENRMPKDLARMVMGYEP